MWNQTRSLALSKVFTLAFALALVTALVASPWLVGWILRVSPTVPLQYAKWFYCTLYSGGALAAVLLASLYSLLHNIGKDEVFSPRNIRHLRRISWCCFLGAGIALVSGLYYIPWLAVAMAGAFVGLVVRVIKNILEQALRLKEENDYTI